jgi:hypothetical protein
VNIHEVVKATRIASEVLAKHTELNATQRLAVCAAFQLALIEAETESAAGPRADSAPAHSQVPSVAGGFTLTAFTPRGASMLEDLDRVLCKVLP